MTRTRRATGTILVVAGLTLMQFVAYELYGTSLRTNAKQSAIGVVVDERLAAAYEGGGDSPPVTTLPPAASDGTIAWGRILIPKIGVKKVLVEGSDREALKAGPGHYVQTPLPGSVGPVGIAGHRTTWGAPFHNIDRLVRGDRVVIVTPAGRYAYTVTGSTIVRPRDAQVLNGDPDSTAEHRLVLTTCHPKYSAAQRLIVYADLTSWEVAG